MRRFPASFLVTLIWAAAPLAAQDFVTLKGHGGPIMDIAVSAEGQVATASFDNAVGLWRGRAPTWLDAHAAAVNCVAFDGDDLLSGGDDFAVIAWREGTPMRLGYHKGKVTDVAVSPDGRLIASASWDGTVGLWHTDAPERFRALGNGGLNDVMFSPDGATLYAAGAGGAIIELSVEGDTQRPLVKHGFGVNVMTMDPAGRWLAYGAVDGVTRVVDLPSGRERADFTLDRRPVLAMAHHPATGQLAVGDGQGYIMILDTETWRITRDFRATRQGPIWALAFSPDGKVIYAGGLDDVAYAWPVALLDEYDPIQGPTRSFQRDAENMPNGERQFMRKCSICHTLTPGASRKAGPSLHGVFGRRAGTVPDYLYSDTLTGSDIIWDEDTIDQLFDLGPDHYIPGSKMPMQRITDPQDRRDLTDFLKTATN
ncbi:c-type cytochrome [Actibacterium atlanticum]|nr:c-type cytochrome [Actibacterium atlanticum]